LCKIVENGRARASWLIKKNSDRGERSEYLVEFVKFDPSRPGPTPRRPDEPWLRSEGARGDLCLVLCCMKING